MEQGNFEEPPVVYDSKVAIAMRAFDQSQNEFFSAVDHYAPNPFSKRRATNTNRKAHASKDAFYATVLAIATDSEMEVEEQSASIATVLCEAQEKRLTHFRKLAPEAAYDEGGTTANEVVEMIQQYFDSDMEPQEIAEEITTQYILGCAVDTDDLLDSVLPSRAARSFLVARQAGDHALEAGKMVAAVTVGTIIAHKILKKLSD